MVAPPPDDVVNKDFLHLAIIKVDNNLQNITNCVKTSHLHGDLCVFLCICEPMPKRNTVKPVFKGHLKILEKVSLQDSVPSFKVL